MNIATKVTPNIIATKDVSLEDKYVSDNGTAYMTAFRHLFGCLLPKLAVTR